MVGGLFWVLAGLVAAGGIGLALAPLWRGEGRGERRASYDMQVFRDQLREVEADRARGLLGEREAVASRLEISRRLLGAAEAEAAEAAGATAPRRLSHRFALLASGLGVCVVAGLYLAIGAPGLPDQPLAARARPDQATAERLAAEAAPPPPASSDDALIDRLRSVLQDRPDDLEGHRLLARSLAALRRWPEARAAQAEVLRLLGDRATAQDQVDLAELGIMAAGGYVSPASEAALARGLALQPKHPIGRYYAAVAAMQAERPDVAWPLFSGLVEEGPADAPWMAAARAGMADAARQTGRPAPPGEVGPEAASPAPTAADLDAAGSMTAEDRQAMIEGMVDQLSQRLATQGGPPEDWARLIRSLAVLGRIEEANAIAAEARAAHAGDAAALSTIEEAVRGAGLGP